MGLRITDRKRTLSAQIQSDWKTALHVQAKIWAERKVGDSLALSETFLTKVEDVRKLDTLAGSISKRAVDLSTEIRLNSTLHIHDEKAFDLSRILNLI